MGKSGDVSPKELLINALDSVKQKTAGRHCPFCGHPKWLIETNPDDTPFGQLVGATVPAPAYLVTDPRDLPSPAIPTLVLTCENCGFVRLHNLTHLLKGSSDGE